MRIQAAFRAQRESHRYTTTDYKGTVSNGKEK